MAQDGDMVVQYKPWRLKAWNSDALGLEMKIAPHYTGTEEGRGRGGEDSLCGLFFVVVVLAD